MSSCVSSRLVHCNPLNRSSTLRLTALTSQLALLQHLRNQPLFRLHMQRLPARPPTLLQLGHRCRDSRSPSTRISKLSELCSRLLCAEARILPLLLGFSPHLLWSQEITIRLASSPNSTNSAAVRCELRSTCAPMPPAKPHSASVTAIPPSEQSFADSTSPWSIISRRLLQRRFLLQLQRRRKAPHLPRTSLAYSDEPNSASASTASPPPIRVSRTSARPGSLKLRPTCLVHVFHHADDAQHRRRVNPLAQGLVVEADIAARDRRLQRFAGLRSCRR